MRLTLKVINVFWNSACVGVGGATDGVGGEAVKLQPTNEARMINVDVNRWRCLRVDLGIEDGSSQELEC